MMYLYTKRAAGDTGDKDMMYYDYRQDDDYLERQDESAAFEYINGEDDFCAGIPAQKPNDTAYMNGWHAAQQQLTGGSPEILYSPEYIQASSHSWNEF